MGRAACPPHTSLTGNANTLAGRPEGNHAGRPLNQADRPAGFLGECATLCTGPAIVLSAEAAQDSVPPANGQPPRAESAADQTKEKTRGTESNREADRDRATDRRLSATSVT